MSELTNYRKHEYYLFLFIDINARWGKYSTEDTYNM